MRRPTWGLTDVLSSMSRSSARETNILVVLAREGGEGHGGREVAEEGDDDGEVADGRGFAVGEHLALGVVGGVQADELLSPFEDGRFGRRVLLVPSGGAEARQGELDLVWAHDGLALGPPCQPSSRILTTRTWRADSRYICRLRASSPTERGMQNPSWIILSISGNTFALSKLAISTVSPYALPSRRNVWQSLEVS